MLKCGNVEVWKCGIVEVRKSGNMQMSLYLTHICLDLVMWKCGSVEVRKSANMQILTWKCRSKESVDFPSHYSQLSLACLLSKSVVHGM